METGRANLTDVRPHAAYAIDALLQTRLLYPTKKSCGRRIAPGAKPQK
jgi:hypothetical protein